MAMSVHGCLDALQAGLSPLTQGSQLVAPLGLGEFIVLTAVSMIFYISIIFPFPMLLPMYMVSMVPMVFTIFMVPMVFTIFMDFSMSMVLPFVESAISTRP